jgi:hypothetical protein
MVQQPSHDRRKRFARNNRRGIGSMICFAKPGLTEDLCVVQKEEFSITCCMCDKYT